MSDILTQLQESMDLVRAPPPFSPSYFVNSH